MLALAVSLITIGKIGDRFGHRKVFITGVIGFALTSAAIGLSGSIALVIGFRALQVLPGAEDADEGVIDGAGVGVRESPAGWLAGGAFVSVVSLLVGRVPVSRR